MDDKAHLESVMAAQWIAYFLKFGDLYPQTNIDYGVQSLDGHYNSARDGLGFPGGDYNNEWAPYLVSHFGGLLIFCNRLDAWKGLQFDWYERAFNNRDQTYNVELGIIPKVSSPKWLATSAAGNMEYISYPVVWRNYYSLVGFHRNKHTGELWLEPIIMPDMNHTMTDAMVVTPEGYAKVSCTESGTNFVYQTIVLKPEKPMTVSAIYLKDKGATPLYVDINGAPATFTKTGAGYGKELKVAWSGTITAEQGLTIKTSDKEVGARRDVFRTSSSPVISREGNSVIVAIGSAGEHRIDILTSDGRVVRLVLGTGIRRYRINGSTEGGLGLNPGLYIIKVMTGGRTLANSLIISQ
jgi:hypothetical protein